MKAGVLHMLERAPAADVLAETKAEEPRA